MDKEKFISQGGKKLLVPSSSLVYPYKEQKQFAFNTHIHTQTNYDFSPLANGVSAAVDLPRRDGFKYIGLLSYKKCPLEGHKNTEFIKD